MSLIRLVYASHSLLDDSNRREELGGILSSARRFNEANDITGFLLATRGAFAQVLEGEAARLSETYARIEADPRHTGLQVLSRAPVAERLFSGWTMGVAEHDETTQFIFGLYGVTPETDLPTQPVDALLDLAGELARRPG